MLEQQTETLGNLEDYPTSHNPVRFHTAVNRLVVPSNRDTRPLTNTFSEGRRPLYGTLNSPKELEVVATYGVYDLVEKMIEKSTDGTYRYRGIYAQEMEPVREAVWELAQTKGVSVILPFHQERRTIGKNMKLARRLVGQNRAYGISTGKDKESEMEAQENGGYILEQAEIFKAVRFDWDLLRDIAGIDQDNIGTNRPLVGSKGITLLAGAILATGLTEAGEISQQQIMVWHDTDITNPEEYGALPLALLPYIQENPEISEIYMSMIARNGPGRNNETVTFAASRLADSRNPLTKRFGYMLEPMVWPLTGERTMRLDRLRTMSLASGMGLETLVNANMAGICATEQHGHIAQVLNPMPKIEKGESLPVREFSIVNTAAHMLMDIGEHIAYCIKLK